MMNSDENTELIVEEGTAYRVMIYVSAIAFLILWLVGLISFAVLSQQPYPKDKINPYIIMLNIFAWPGIIVFVYSIKRMVCG